MTIEAMAPLMFAGLIAVMLIGFPVAFSLAALGLGFGFLAIYLGFFPAGFLGTIPLAIFNTLSNDLLLAIPFFTFMGAIVATTAMARTARVARATTRTRLLLALLAFPSL